MISVVNKLKKIRDTMNGVSGKAYHYNRPKDVKPAWIVWQEDGSSTDIWANNHMGEQQLHGTVDLYTLEEYDPLIDEIQEALNGVMVGWNLQGVDYEDETNLIHFEWEWTI